MSNEKKQAEKTLDDAIEAAQKKLQALQTKKRISIAEERAKLAEARADKAEAMLAVAREMKQPDGRTFYDVLAAEAAKRTAK